MRCRKSFLGGCALLALTGGVATPAMAQDQEQAAEITNEGDIIVSARRRDETAQETPVALTVLNDALLDRYAIRGVASIQSLTPGLYTGESSGAMGGTISLRGIGSGDSMAFIDLAVSANVDGVPISSAQILRAAQMDLKQIEVLRGPQALFFGKNSPGGIISLTTADPGNDTEFMARVGYEFKAREKYAELTYSTPLSDTVGLRLAGRYGKMKGYIRVVSPDVAGQLPMDIKRFPKQDEVFFRGTLVWEPSDRVKVRLKGTQTDTYMVGGSSQFSDVTACPYGTPQRPSEDAGNCRNDGRILLTKQGPAVLALSPYLTNGNGSRKNTQTLLTGQIDYEMSDAIKLTSVSGYYRIHERLTSNGGYGPISNNFFAVRFSNEQYSQELRLASSFDGPLDFLVGGFYEERKLYTLTSIVVPQFLSRLATESTNQKQQSYSGFGQLLFDATDQIQLTVGGRYTHEVKNLLDYTVTPVIPAGQPNAGQFGTPIDVTTLPGYASAAPGANKTRKVFNNFSPEATVTYKPSDDVMLFASYKRGFKSGGFDAGYTGGAILGATRLSVGQLFKPEKVEGVEGGLKSTFADRQVTFNLTGYWYDYKDLQVPTFDTIARSFRLQNAASARVRGIELELRYRPNPLPGLSLHATGAFNDAKFRRYLSDCYQGQTFALGCNQVQGATPNVFTQQDLSGRRLRKAPKIAATFGGYYETNVSDGLLMGLSVDGSYSGSYVYGSNYQPLAVQDDFAKIDATLRFFTEDKRWEIAAIGRNLTNKRSLINGIDRTGTGSGKGRNDLPSCTASGPTPPTTCAALSDILGTPTMPRTVAIQATFRY